MRDPIQIAVIAAAVLLMVGWYFTLPEPGSAPEAPAAGAARDETPQETALSQRDELPAPPGASQPAPEIAASESQPAPMTQRQMVSLENDAVRLRVSSAGARVESVELLNYNDRIGDGAQPVQLVTAASRGTLLLFLGEGPLDGAESATHELIEDGERTVTFGLERDGVAIRRTVTLDERGYGGELRVSLVNRGDQPIEPRFELAMYGRERAADAPDHFQTYQLVASVDGDLERMAVKGIESPGFFKNIFGGGDGTPGASLPAPVEWSGVESQYFLLAALAENPRESSAFTGPVARDTGLTLMRYPSFSVPPGRQVERVYRLYFGPKLADQVTAVDARLDPAVQVGWQWVRPIVDGFSWLLVWCHDHLVGNYGAAIIMLTILLRLATFPLTQKSMTSMKRFGEIAPLMKDLQAKYKDDKQKLSEEMMKLYKTQGVNPVTAMGGGCLPMLIQMPFMIALYFALQGSIELRHAPFIGWIQDLSAPEQLFAIAGIPVRVLPLAMGASMLLQQRLSPQTGDPQQRQMMMWMSVVFTFMFYQFPAGLLLYWFVSNLLGIGQQLVVNRNRAPAKA